MMLLPTSERAEELKALAKRRLEDYIKNDFWDYCNWDDLIECEEEITEDELRWLENNIVFVVDPQYRIKTM